MEDSEKEITFTTKQAAEFLHVKPQTLDTWRLNKIGPAFSRIGTGRGRILYRKSVLVKMLEENEGRPGKKAESNAGSGPESDKRS